MSQFFHENHPNPNEIFPLEGMLGSPTEGAKPVKLAGDLLAALAAMAAALAALFFLYLTSTPLYIGTDTAQIEVEVFNREPGEAIFWTLVEGGPPATLAPPDDRQELEEDQETLTLTNLKPNTEYTIVFFTMGEDGQTEIRHTFTFVTDGEGKPPALPQTPPEGDPPGSEGESNPPSSSTTQASSEPTQASTATTESAVPPVGGGSYDGGDDDGGEGDPTTVPSDPANPTLSGPTVEEPVMRNYQAPSDPYIDNPTPGSYDVVFTFDQVDATPKSIRLTGTVTQRNYLGDYDETTENVDVTYSYDAANDTWSTGVTGSDGKLTLTYPVSSAYNSADLTATLNYDLGEDNLNQSLASNVFFSDPSFLYRNEESFENRFITADTEGIGAGDWMPVTVTFEAAHAGTYGLNVLDFSIFTGEDPQVDVDTECRNIKAISDRENDQIHVTFDLLVREEWIDRGYLSLEVSVMVDCTTPETGDMGLTSDAYVDDQINFTTGYSVAEITKPLNQGLYGMICKDISLSAGLEYGKSLTDVVPGQEVTLVMDVSGTGEKNFTLAADPVNIAEDIQMTIGYNRLQAYENSESTGTLYFTFAMPARDVTSDDIDFKFYEYSETASAAMAAPLQAPQTASAIPSGLPHSVGPLTITQEANGLRCTHVTFHTSELTSAASLAEVPAGETVYMEILLQGSARRSFQLSASFAPSARIQNLRILNQDKVSILDTDAYLRIAFTMPDAPVTAADLGFRGFIINE